MNTGWKSRRDAFSKIIGLWSTFMRDTTSIICLINNSLLHFVRGRVNTPPLPSDLLFALVFPKRLTFFFSSKMWEEVRLQKVSSLRLQQRDLLQLVQAQEGSQVGPDHRLQVCRKLFSTSLGKSCPDSTCLVSCRLVSNCLVWSCLDSICLDKSCPDSTCLVSCRLDSNCLGSSRLQRKADSEIFHRWVWQKSEVF